MASAEQGEGTGGEGAVVRRVVPRVVGTATGLGGDPGAAPFLRPVPVAMLLVSAMMRRGCVAALEATDDFEVVYVGAPEDHLELADVSFDIVVVGITRHGDAGARAVQHLAADDECVLAVLAPGMSRTAALALGAHACIDGLDPDETALEVALHRLLRGEVDPGSGTAAPQLLEISPRERDVLEQLALGRTDREIAAALGISVRTVQSHLDRIREKTRRRRRAELTVLAFELGIAPPPRRDLTLDGRDTRTMRRHRLAIASLVTLVAVLGLAGLVGVAAADRSPLSDEQWRRQANSICKRGSEQLSGAADQAFGQSKPDDQPSLAQITEYAGLAQPIIQQQMARIDALAEPTKLKKKVKKLLAAAHADLERFVADPSIGLEGNPFSATTLRAEKLRLKSC